MHYNFLKDIAFILESNVCKIKMIYVNFKRNVLENEFLCLQKHIK